MTADTVPVRTNLSAVLQRWLEVVERSSRPRIGDARALIEFRPEGDPPFSLAISSDGIRTIGSGFPHPTSVIVGSSDGIEKVLADGQDITHQIASGGLSVVSGSYEDVILISRVLRHLDWEGWIEK